MANDAELFIFVEYINSYGQFWSLSYFYELNKHELSFDFNTLKVLHLGL